MGLVNRERTAWQVRIDRSAWTFQPEKVGLVRPDGTSQQGQVSPACQTRQASLDRSAQKGQLFRTVQREESAQIGYSG
jgi:hypothetical protein